MNPPQIVLFEKCPLCRNAKVTIKKASRFSFFKTRIGVCSECGAKFEAVGTDWSRLVFCEPRKLVGKHDCGERILRGCYLDEVLSKRDWQRIAEGGESSEVSKFLEINAEFSQGDLPIHEEKNFPFVLEDGELIHHVSVSVYLDEQGPSKRKRPNEGSFYLTNKRMLYVKPSGTIAIQLSNVERIEECPPGFLVREKDAFEPRYFFMSRFDPAFAAVAGAMRRLKRKS